MFAAATKNLLEEVDSNGELLPVTSLNDNIKILSLVIKRNRYWPWQKNKYFPSDFCLDDVLLEDTPIKTVVTETDFIKYDGKFKDNIEGNLEGNFVRANVNISAKDTAKLQSSLGSLKKEELDVPELLRESKDRVMDMSHSLVKQTMEKRREVFGVVKERILTTQPCSVIEEVQQGGQCGGVLNLFPKTTKVSIKESGTLSMDSNVTLEIPPHTALAYGLMEIMVKLNGHYELCLMSDTKGNFEEVDGPVAKKLVGLGAAAPASQQSLSIKQELDRLSNHFQKLSSLPASTRSSLLQHLTSIMQDPEAVSILETVLNQMCLDVESLDMLEDVENECSRQHSKAILELVGQSSPGEEDSPPTDKIPSKLHAVHLIISALDEMSDDGLAVLGTCCSPELLLVLELLVQCVTGSGEMSLKGSALAPLTTEVWESIEGLFASADIILSREADTLKTDISQQPGHLSLVLCIAIRAIAELARSV